MGNSFKIWQKLTKQGRFFSIRTQLSLDIYMSSNNKSILLIGYVLWNQAHEIHEKDYKSNDFEGMKK